MAQLKKEEIGKLARFLKSNNKKKTSSKLKEISSELSSGITSKIIKEKHFITKKRSTITTYAHTTVFNDKTALIKDITISKHTTEKDLLDTIKNCTDFSKTLNSKNIELQTNKNLEPFFKKAGFEKIGEKIEENSQLIFMKYHQKEDVQASLKTSIDDSKTIQDISEKTSQQLRKLR